jgi:cytochrome c oxidase subunit 1
MSDGIERARSLTLRYLLASTAIFFVAGLLGLLLRTSQADLGRLDPNFFYAVMTAHGLGAFVGWAGFACMGLSLWVLASVGFPLRRLGAALAQAAFWLMLAGVGGILVTTLLMNFAASWVFLYPLPFHPAGQWGDATTGLFSASVLVVGLSIIAWCACILHTVLSPALHAVRPTLPNRLGLALGFGYLAPRRFATNPSPVPYAVIPLTVIGIDMIIATLPLAVLLVIMIVQSAAPSVTVDPLLAKNILWFFGHPVVYLLLFPAVAVYYLLIPRYAKRPLVAANVVALSWVLAVVVNVAVWAHHIYIDYPSGSAQAAINTAMQPLTFAITIPSALSLYSLFMTIYRSRFEWTAASTALFLGLVGWLLAGLSGVINATIAFDAVVHNTLWIVGHFHHMALLNVGLLIFGATYAFLPELTGKALYSDRLGKWHIWLTFLFGTAAFALWLVQGLEGAPRRFAVLPERYDTLTQATVPLLIIVALAQLLFAWNIVQTLRGKGGRYTAAQAEPAGAPAV